MAPLIGVIGSLQAMGSNQTAGRLWQTSLREKIVMYDAMTCQFREMKLMRNPGVVCGQ